MYNLAYAFTVKYFIKFDIYFDRSEQTKAAEKASIAVFADNLRRLLLMPPVKGKTVLGIDPGFKNGCKCAVVSPNSEFCSFVCLDFVYIC